jgi:glycerol-3-phosphate dehydrogenase
VRFRRAIVTLVLGASAAIAALLSGNGMGLLDGLVYDLSLAVTDRRPGTTEEPVAVIALDRDSLASDELAKLPRVLMSPVWAKLLNALTEAEVRYLIEQEWAATAEDVLWRRSKLGLHLSREETAALEGWMRDTAPSAPASREPLLGGNVLREQG